MAINLDAIKNRLNSLKNTNNRSSHMWRPEPGEHQIRIVPYLHKAENAPFIELYFHYKLSKRSILSPVSFGRPDPIVNFAEKMKQTGDKNDWVMGRKLEPKMRTYVPVIVRGAESEGVKFWGFGKQIYEELLGYFADDDYGDLSDVQTGRDIVVTVKSPEETGREYAETTIRIKPNPTQVSSNPEIVEKIKQHTNITELYPEPSYEELKTHLQTYLGQSDDSDDVTYTKNNTLDKSATRGENTTSTPIASDDIGVTFEDLF